ncbi:MAG: hypothetical protein V7K32_27545 [Nostoc sp.]
MKSGTINSLFKLAFSENSAETLVYLGQEEFINSLAAYTTMSVFTLKLIAENESIYDVAQ